MIPINICFKHIRLIVVNSPTRFHPLSIFRSCKCKLVLFKLFILFIRIQKYILNSIKNLDLEIWSICSTCSACALLFSIFNIWYLISIICLSIVCSADPIFNILIFSKYFFLIFFQYLIFNLNNLSLHCLLCRPNI